MPSIVAAFALPLALHATLARSAAPTGLLCDFQRSPALGVRGAGGDAPRF